ncbi:MAG: hypothetical protein HOB52_07845 [Euryarchaeota archaeon]|nr:hypothetical protein [Euryarchaeota archaeon]
MSNTLPPPEWARTFFIIDHMKQFEYSKKVNFSPSDGAKIISSIIDHLNQNPPELGKTGKSMEIECLVEDEKSTLKINPIGIRWQRFTCYDHQCQRESHDHYNGDFADVLVYIDNIKARIMIRSSTDADGILTVIFDGIPKFDDDRINDLLKSWSN